MKEKKLTQRQLMGLIKTEEKKLNSVRSTYSKMQNTLAETLGTIESIKEIEKNPEKVLMKLGSGVMVGVKIENTKKVTRAFSQKGYLEEETKDTKKWLNDRKKDIQTKMKKISSDIKKVQSQLRKLVAIAKKVEEEKRKLNEKNIATK